MKEKCIKEMCTDEDKITTEDKLCLCGSGKAYKDCCSE